MTMRSIASAAIALLLTACGTGRVVHLVIEIEGEARAVDLVLRVDDETRFFDAVDHGHEIVERDLPDGARISLKARNGGDDGAILLRATIDGCDAGTDRCDVVGCEAFLEITVREAC